MILGEDMVRPAMPEAISTHATGKLEECLALAKSQGFTHTDSGRRLYHKGKVINLSSYVLHHDDECKVGTLLEREDGKWDLELTRFPSREDIAEWIEQDFYFWRQKRKSTQGEEK